MFNTNLVKLYPSVSKHRILRDVYAAGNAHVVIVGLTSMPV